jgi:hypothetical protein
MDDVATQSTVYLEDYSPPPFLIPQVARNSPSVICHEAACQRTLQPRA